MKRKILLSIIFIIVLVILLIYVNFKNNGSKTDGIKIKLSCSNETSFVNYKKHTGYIIYLNKNNKLIKYEKKEKNYSFSDNDAFDMVCESSSEIVSNNNKLYKFLTEKVECKHESNMVLISGTYDISKLGSKNMLKEIKDY